MTKRKLDIYKIVVPSEYETNRDETTVVYWLTCRLDVVSELSNEHRFGKSPQ